MCFGIPGQLGNNGPMTSPSTLDAVRSLTDAAIERISGIDDGAELTRADAELLGKSSELSSLRASLRDVDPDERKVLGRELNDAAPGDRGGSRCAYAGSSTRRRGRSVSVPNGSTSPNA